MKKHLLLLALFALLGGVLFGVSDAFAKTFSEPYRACTSKETTERQCQNQPTVGKAYMFGAGDYCRQDNTQDAKIALAYIQYQKSYTALEDQQKAEVEKLLAATTKERSAVGLVPCGRSCDDPTTAVNEAADCAFCHFFVLLNTVINWVVWRIVPALAVLMVVLGGFVLLTSRGSPGQSSKGKDMLIWTFAGYAVVLLAWIVVNSFFTGIGVMKWTGLRGETGEFERYFAHSTGHALQDLDRSGDKAWSRGDWDGARIELNHASWPEPKIRKITGSVTDTVFIDEPVFTSGQDPAKVKYKIGGWWQFACGLDFTTAISQSSPVAPILPAVTQFVVQPYIVYPADKPIVPEYETTVNQFTPELRDWYNGKVGATFTVLAAKVEKSPLDYVTLRCGTKPTSGCLNDRSMVTPEAQNVTLLAAESFAQKQPGTIALIFAVGGGGVVSGNPAPNFGGYALVGDWVLEPISRIRNDWGIPCSFAKQSECEVPTAKGTVAHELGHAFGIVQGINFPDYDANSHPPAGSETIMVNHVAYPDIGFLPKEISFLLKSPFFK